MCDYPLPASVAASDGSLGLLKEVIYAAQRPLRARDTGKSALGEEETSI
jgi:hypothetical protein